MPITLVCPEISEFAKVQDVKNQEASQNGTLTVNRRFILII